MKAEHREQIIEALVRLEDLTPGIRFTEPHFQQLSDEWLLSRLCMRAIVFAQHCTRLAKQRQSLLDCRERLPEVITQMQELNETLKRV